MICEQFNEGDEICGAIACVRARQENIALWTRIPTNEAAQFQMHIYQRWFFNSQVVESFLTKNGAATDGWRLIIN